MKQYQFAITIFATLLAISVNSFAAEKVVVVPLGGGSLQAQTSYLSLPPIAFVPTLFQPGQPDVFINSGEYMVPRSTNVGGFAAPVQLPQGAVVDDVSCYNLDNSTAASFANQNSKFRFWRKHITGSEREELIPATVMGTEGNGNSAEAIEYSAVSISSPIIDNQNYYYGVVVLLELTAVPVSNLDLHFLGCRITYTHTVVVP